MTDPIDYRRLFEARVSPDPDAPPWWPPLAAALDDAPDPDRARKLAAAVLDAIPPDPLHRAANARPEALARILAALCGIAPFFAPYLIRHPDWLLELLDQDLALARDPGGLAECFNATFDADPELTPEARLRCFKYFELARITVRDCSDAWVPLASTELTLHELSGLADLLLSRGMDLAEERISKALEPPSWCDSVGKRHPLEFCVLGLGKLGAFELNYSSDVDLVYFYQAPPPDFERHGSEPVDYFSRLAREFSSIIASKTLEGFLYRVDLELRPHGTQGALVVTDDALRSYYESWAAPWEKAAFMKARPVAGNAALGWRTIRGVAPLIFRDSMNIRAAEGIRSLKDKIHGARGGDSNTFDVKIDPGGIRDVEFIAQVLQLLHGGKIPQIRDRSTQGALRNLEAVGLLDPDTAATLHASYLFFRRVENRLQMEGERQVHQLPKNPEALTRLARSMNYLGEGATERFLAEIERHRDMLRGLATDSFGEGNRQRIVDLFRRTVPDWITHDASRQILEQLAEHLASEIDTGPDSERALNNLDRFIHGIGKRRFFYELLLDRPELVRRLAALFAASNYLSTYLARYPRLIEPLFNDPDALLFDRAELSRDYQEVERESASDERDPLEDQLNSLRLFHHRHVVNVGLLDLASKTTRLETETALSEIGEVCIEQALLISREQLARRATPIPDSAELGEFLIVGMGKLASRELTYGSDLDLIFLFRSATKGGAGEALAQEYFVRLAQRFISALQTPTELGFCYEVDARLRPSGNQGMLVCSIQAYERYHESTAQTWERQALLRARPIAGTDALAERFRKLRIEILSRPHSGDLAEEIGALRARMEEELGRESRRHRDYKTGRGGVLDIECAVQYLQLLHGNEYLELFEVSRLESQLALLEHHELIDADVAKVLMGGWEFLQNLGSRMRIVENRSISSLDEERGDLENLARQLSYPAASREGGARRALLKDYDEITEEIRRAYLEVLA